MTFSPPADPREALAAARHQTGTFLVWFAVAPVLALLYLVAVEPVYSARALVLVAPEERTLLEPSAARPTSAREINARVDSEVAILDSESVRLATVEALELVSAPDFRPAPGPLATLRAAMGNSPATPLNGERLLGEILDKVDRATDVRRLGPTHLIQVTARSVDPRRAATLANGLAETYIRQQLRSKTESAQRGGERLRGQLTAARHHLTQAEDDLDRYMEGIVGRVGEGGGEQLRGTLSRSAVERAVLEVRLESVDGALRQRDWRDVATSLQTEALAELARSYERTEGLFDAAAPGSEAALDLSAELARLDDRLDERARSEVARLRARVAELDEAAQGTRRALREEALASDLPAGTLAELYQLQQDAGIARRHYAALLSRARQLEAEALVQVADSRIASPALVPSEPSAPDVPFVLTLAFLAGLGIGGGAAFLNARHFGGVHSEEQLARATLCRSSASVPRIGKSRGRQSVADLVVETPLSPFAEAIRRLGAAIDQSPGPAGERGRLVLVTSSLPGEGKTATALALARSWSLAGRRTLLIEADLRRPGLPQNLGLDVEHGLGDALALVDEPACDLLDAAATADPGTGATVVPGGHGHASAAARLLQSAKMREMLDDALRRYEAVILDTPPLLPVSDARCLAPLADHVLFCVRSGGTGQAELRRGLDELEAGLGGRDSVLAVLTMHSPGGATYDYYDETAG